MRVHEISVTDYRNISQVRFAPGKELTVLCGDNGQGKTNLLESIWLLTGGKSFRAGKDEELIRWGQPFGLIEAEVNAQNRDQTIRLAIGGKDSQRPGRTVRLNGVERGRAGSIAGTFTAVVFHPEHLRLVKGSPEGRRKFLDTALCQLYPNYLAMLRRYTRLVTQKNALLKKYEFIPDAQRMLEVFNREMAECGQEVTLRRMEYLCRLREYSAANYRDISSGSESMDIHYLPSAEYGKLLDKLNQMQTTELRAGCCLVGPHREDFEITVADKPAKIYASQGQQRSAVLSLKLAEAAQAARIMGEHPVMLLDDVLSELDDGRQKYLLTRMEGKQTFVTSCDSAAFSRTNGKILLVRQGEIKEVE